MNTIQRMVVLAALCLAAAPVTQAQHKYQSAAELQQQWFTVDTMEQRYTFTINLDKDEYLTVQFRRSSDWSSPNDLLNAFNAADKVMAAYKDSLQASRNTKALDIYIPASQRNLITRYRQTAAPDALMTIGEDGPAELKVGMDTLRIFQKKAENVNLYYTFILKDLASYSRYAKDEPWKDKVTGFIDSEMNRYRGKWKKPDASKHGLIATYDPVAGKSATSQYWRFTDKLMLMEGGFGVSLIRNTLCPNVELGLGVYLARGRGANTFARVSVSAIARFTETSPDRYKAYGTSFVNLEIGGESSRLKESSGFYRTSLGFGYKLINKKEEDRDPSMDKYMYRLFFTYAVNRWLVLSPELVSNFKKDDRYNGWYGLSVNLKLF